MGDCALGRHRTSYGDNITGKSWCRPARTSTHYTDKGEPGFAVGIPTHFCENDAELILAAVAWWLDHTTVDDAEHEDSKTMLEELRAELAAQGEQFTIDIGDFDHLVAPALCHFMCSSYDLI